MLVMAPTRELAVQIDQDAKKFLGHAGATTALAYGGAPKRDQLDELRRNPQLLTATPGRLNDFLEMNSVSLGAVDFCCLDEADRMLDMGFEPQIRKILSHAPKRRQTFMFTATWPKEVRRLAWDFMNDPVEIRVGDADALCANQDIDQKVTICRDDREKEDNLIRLVRECQDQVLVFVATKKQCSSLGSVIYRTGARVETIHGDRDQASRDKALGSFKSGQSKVLVATDVAARGLDVKTIRLVINYDPANNAEDYVHRIGRTGRAGMQGTAYSFLTNSDGKKAQQIMKS
jgi:ATP-dependent RNA helicase DDX5/DBP2